MRKQSVDLVPVRLQRGLGQRREGTAVDGAERLIPARNTRNRDHGICGAGLFNDETQQRLADEWQIHGEDEIQLRGGSGQCGMDAGQWSVARINVFDHPPVGRKFGRRPNDAHLRGKSAQQIQGLGQQRSALELEKGLIGSHAATAPAGQDECAEVRHTESVTTEPAALRVLQSRRSPFPRTRRLGVRPCRDPRTAA